ncbi:hypothetical protein [Mycobacterium marinum]|uniref:hypothetical protein n=1 Tax=Mycobacterium marinum TaxID=1781 RepID=UPI00235900E7|nr:hypothetical protein [Mycobacterium marinum]MDC9017866.1 hypothetical protein [Mycobacterium marinum]
MEGKDDGCISPQEGGTTRKPRRVGPDAKAKAGRTSATTDAAAQPGPDPTRDPVSDSPETCGGDHGGNTIGRAPGAAEPSSQETELEVDHDDLDPGIQACAAAGDGPDPALEPGHDVTPQRRARSWTKVAAALAAAAVLAGTAALGWLWKEQRDNEIAGRQALSAALRFTENLTTIDSANIDENFRETIDGSTGEFKEMYLKSSAALQQALRENKASAHGVVVESAIKSTSPDTVVVVLFVDQSVSNARAPEPRLDRSRVEVTMKKVDGRWLAAKVELP